MQQVEAFRASDGQLFETAELCLEHEASMVWRSRIDEFVASDLYPYRKKAAPTRMAEKVIVAWEAFKGSRKSDIAQPEGEAMIEQALAELSVRAWCTRWTSRSPQCSARSRCAGAYTRGWSGSAE